MKKNELGLNLKAVREYLSLSQGELSEKIGIDQGRLSKIESGKIQVSAITAYNLAVKLNVNPNYLLGIESNMFLGDTKHSTIVSEPKIEYGNEEAYYKMRDELYNLKDENLKLKTEILDLKTELLHLK